MLLLIGLLAVTVAAAVVGLWSVAVVDLAVALIVAIGLRVAFPVPRAVLTYREILERQGRAVPMEAAEPLEAVPMEEPVMMPLEQSETLVAVPLAAA